METARLAVEHLMEEDTILQNCQRQLGHQLPLSSYLLKPVQRLTKYQLLLKDLKETSGSPISRRRHSAVELINFVSISSYHIPL